MPTSVCRSGMLWPAVLALVLCSVAVADGERLMAVVRRAPVAGAAEANAPNQWAVFNYGITTRVYDKSNLSALIADLKKAQLLVFGAGSYPDANELLGSAEGQAAVTAFLKAGGTMVFPYNSGPVWWGNKKVEEFLRQIGVFLPPRDGPRDRYAVEMPAGAGHSFLKTPNDLTALPSNVLPARGGADSMVIDPGIKGTALVCEKGQPSHIAVLVQEGILGKGRVLISRLPGWGFTPPDKPNPFYDGLLENLLTGVYGPLAKGMPVAEAPAPAQGETPSAVKSGFLPAASDVPSRVNPLYLRTAPATPWWRAEWPSRLPVLVHEPLGADCAALPVAVSCDLPGGTTPESVRIVTPWGREIPSQARLLKGGGNRCEVTFVSDSRAHEHQVFFLYFGGPSRIGTPSTSDVHVREEAGYFVLSNSRIIVRVRKDIPRVVEIRPQGSPTGNHLLDEAGLSPEGRGGRLFDPQAEAQFGEGRVREDGPVRTVVEFTRQRDNAVVAFALYPHSPRLDYAVENPGGADLALSRQTAWLPGKGRDNGRPDALYLCGDTALRRLNLAEDGNVLDGLNAGALGEGWYAIEDTTTGQAAGELFDTRGAGKLSLQVSGAYGYLVNLGARVAPGEALHGALVSCPDRSGYARVREEYLRFKHPPEVLLGPAQAREMAPASWRVPVFGKEMVLAYHWPLKDRHAVLGLYPEEPWRVLPHAIEWVKSSGGNYISTFPTYPVWKSQWASERSAPYLGKLVELAHQAGVGVQVSLNSVLSVGKTSGTSTFFGKSAPKDFDGDKIRYKYLAVQAAEELAAYDIDLCLLQDEDVYAIHNPYANKTANAGVEAFRTRYGMDPAMPVQVEKLREPAHHLTALFQMDVYTDFIESMARAMKRRNPKILIADQVNESAMLRIHAGAPHDFERHSDFLDTLSMDLYGKPDDSYKYDVKFMRATFDNRGPVMLYVGCTAPARFVHANQSYMLMWGAQGIFQFPPRGSMDLDVIEETRRNFQHLRYTGLGDLVARSLPAKRVALFRDREGMIESIKRGEWSRTGSGYDTRIRNITYLRHFQCDILFSKYFAPDKVAQYPALVVTSHPTLSDRHAQVIEAYVQSGGRVLLEAETIRNTTLHRLAGITPGGAPAEGQVSVTGARPFSFIGAVTPVAQAGSEVLVRAEDGKPLLFSKAVGKGRVLYTPLCLSEKVLQEDVATFFRGTMDDLAGPPLYAISGSGAGMLDSNALTVDGKSYLLAVYNPTASEARVALEWASPQRPDTIVDFDRGDVRKFEGKATLAIPSARVVFWYLGDAAAMALPPTTAPASPGLGYSRQPGEGVLPLVPQRQEAAVRSERRQREAGVSYIGVLTDKGKEGPASARVTGDEGILAALQDRRGLRAEPIQDLDAGTLSRYDAVIVPNIGVAAVPPLMGEGWIERLRAFAQAGGGVLLCHHAVGFRPCAFNPFPEVGAPAPTGIVKLRNIRVSKSHPITDAGSIKKRFPDDEANPAFQAQLDAFGFDLNETFQTGYPDYVALTPGPSGEALAASVTQEGKGGDVVLVAGKFGGGRVILCGLGLGLSEPRDERMPREDANLLVNAAYWLVEK